MSDQQAEIARLREWVNDLQSGMYINCVYCGHRYGPREDTPVAMSEVLKEHIRQCPEHPLAKSESQMAEIRAKLESIVCTGGCDAGVVLLSQEGPCHTEIRDGRQVQVYDHDYFSPLGDALIELYQLAGGTIDE